MNLSYTLTSGGRAFGLATEVYFVAVNPDVLEVVPGSEELLKNFLSWFPEEYVTDMLPSLFSLADYHYRNTRNDIILIHSYVSD